MENEDPLIMLILIQQFLLILSNQPRPARERGRQVKFHSTTACHRDGVGRGNSWLATERRGASECLANSFDTDASIPHPDRMPFSTTAGWSDSIKTASRRVSPVSVRNYCWIICMDPARLHTWTAKIVEEHLCWLQMSGRNSAKAAPETGDRQRFQAPVSPILFILVYLFYFSIPFSFYFPRNICIYTY